MSVGDLVEKFRAVALERVEKMNLLLVDLEREPDDAESREDLLREIHTLKGEAKMMGFADINLVSHLTEHLLLGAAERNFDVVPPLMDLLFEGLDMLRSLLTKSAGESDAPIDLTGFVDRVTEARRRLDVTGTEELAAEEPEETKDSPAEEITDRPRDVSGARLRIQAGGSLRVDLSKLERLGEMAGEVLLINRRVDYGLAELESFREALANASEAAAPNLPKSQSNRFRELGHQLDARITQFRDQLYRASARSSQLDQETRRLRHVSLAQVLSHYPRAVRDLAKSQDKEVRLVTEFGDVEVDRVILSGLSDPLLHLVRNAVDHGIESPDEREKLGKEPEGEIRLNAEYAGDSIRVTLSDDGRGMDPETIAEKALEKGLLEEGEAERRTDQELLNFIFEPGFSTRDEVTDISGRGIGMDVVRRQISAIGGNVEIESEVGEGTTFTIVLPVSSAISSVLMVMLGEQVFALPAKDIERVDAIDRADISEVADGYCIQQGGELVGFLDWRGLLGVPGRNLPGGKLTILVLRRGGRRVAVWVDDVIGEREAMTRPLGEFLGGLRICRGVALTDAGEVVPMLNVGDLLVQAQLQAARHEPQRKVRATMEMKRATRVKTILVVEDSEITRSLVTGIVQGLGYRVLEAEDGYEAWQRMQNTRVDLVLTDIQMPRMDGLELLEEVRGDERFKTTPVVILTTLGEPADKERAMALGANGYLVKLNFQEEELIQTVRRYLA